MFKINQVGALDIGFGRCQGVDGLENFVSHRSCVVKIDDPELANFSDKTGHYVVGEDAISFSDEQRASTDTQYFESNEFRVLFLYTLLKLQKAQQRQTNDNTPVDWVLMVGLPIEFYERLKGRFEKFLIDAVRSSWSDKPLLTVNKIHICQQPLGVLWSPNVKSLDGEVVRLHTFPKVAVIDGGDGTTDLIEGYKGRIPKTEKSAGLNKGASNIHSDTLLAYKSKYTLDSETNVHHLDKALRSDGMFDVGKDVIEVRASKPFKDAVKSYMAEIKEIMSSKWEAFNTTDRVAIAGGIVKLVTPEAFIHAGIPERKLCIGDSDTIVLGFREFLVAMLVHKKLLVLK